MDQLAAQIRVERHVQAIDELGIPRFRITNGPVGVGMGDGTPSPPATSRPMTIGLGGGGSSKVIPLYTVTPLDGLRDVLAGLGSSVTVTKVTVADDLSNLDEAGHAARAADVVVLMAGSTWRRPTTPSASGTTAPEAS